MCEECGCGSDANKKVLLYSCSGGANVAEVSDRVVRQLMSEGVGSMFCLAGIGAGEGQMIKTAADADLNVVIDGCPVDCARKIFDAAGLDNYVQFKVTDMGVEKLKGVRASDEEVQKVAAQIREKIRARL